MNTFPDFLGPAYATLRGGRCSNNLWHSVIFPMGPIFCRCSYSVSELSGSSVSSVYFSGLYPAARSALDLSFSLPRWAYLYRLEVFRSGVNLCPLLRSS